MTELDARARALIRASRAALKPSAVDRARSDAALRERLGPDALPADLRGAPARVPRWKSVAGLALGGCVLGVVAFIALRPIASHPAPRAQLPATLPPSAAPITAPPPPSPALPAGRRIDEAQETPGSPARDRLAPELALLSRATQALHAGRAAAALKALDEHQRKFPNGVLSEERRAAKAQALCALGRIAEGRAELARLTPHSPSAVRAEQLCASPPSAAESLR